jgi:hypothetical protein
MIAPSPDAVLMQVKGTEFAGAMLAMIGLRLGPRVPTLITGEL